MEALRKQIELDARPPSSSSSQPGRLKPKAPIPPSAATAPASKLTPKLPGAFAAGRTFDSPAGNARRAEKVVIELSDSSDESDGGSDSPRRPSVPKKSSSSAPRSSGPSSASSSVASGSNAPNPWAAPSRFFQKPAQPTLGFKPKNPAPSAPAGAQAAGVHAPFRPPRFTTPQNEGESTYAQKASSPSSATGFGPSTTSTSIGSSTASSSRSTSRAPSPATSLPSVASRAINAGAKASRASLTPSNPFNVARPLDVSRPAQRPAFLPSNLDFGRSASSKPKAARDDSERTREAGGEEFDLSKLRLESGDLDRVSPTEADAHMRELLEAAVSHEGEGEEFQEGEDVVVGFREGIRLMPHQILGTRWMKARETSRRTGGILGDDMGLGKTVQSLARIVSGPPKKSELKAGWTGGTLIVCPLAVMSQWKHEIENKTTRDLLSVCEHQGSDRTTLDEPRIPRFRNKVKEDLLDYDVVITTYNVVQQEHGNHLAAAASSSSASAAGKKKAGGRRGSSSSSDSSDSDSGFGASLTSTKKKAATKKPARRVATGGGASAKRALFAVRWHRIILDEAQNIKNRASKTAKACIALESKFRWCLTGTPIQNNIEELYPLFAFLRIRPLNDWDYFKTTIAKPVKEGRTKLAMKKLQLVLGSIMLRRLKTAEVNGKKILNLPARTVTVVKCLFDGDERTFYQALAERTALRMSKFMKAGSVSSNYTSILTMLLRLRQACDHPELVSQSFASDPDAIAPVPTAPAGSALTDDGGQEADELAALLGGLSVGSRPTCTVCSEPLPVGAPSTVVVCSTACAEVQAMAERAKAEIEGLPPSSAKTRMILDILDRVRVQSVGQEKTIIFSQFTKMLDKIEPFLRHAGHKFVRYDGSLKNEDRTRVLDRFRTSQTTNVILISFKAGSTGLNLTAANHVILVDLWWNPALEEQAFDRAHRLGQTRDVEIYKLAINETVEDKILALQEKKRELASAALAGTKLNMGKGGNRLGVDELMMLFKGIVSHDDDDDN